MIIEAGKTRKIKSCLKDEGYEISILDPQHFKEMNRCKE